MPRAYCSDPHGFGHRQDVWFDTPPGGNDIDRDIAHLQHDLIIEWRRRRRSPSTGVLRERFGISKQVFSRVARGERFIGERVQAALLLMWRDSGPASA